MDNGIGSCLEILIFFTKTSCRDADTHRNTPRSGTACVEKPAEI